MSRLNHPNVLRFFGLVVDGPMVVGIMTGGRLAGCEMIDVDVDAWGSRGCNFGCHGPDCRYLVLAPAADSAENQRWRQLLPAGCKCWFYLSCNPAAIPSHCLVPRTRFLLPAAEFAAAGSLASYLRSGVGFIPLRQRAQLALHAVNGMAYLHSLKVVHFDVKPDNLLVDGDWLSEGGPVCKVVSALRCTACVCVVCTRAACRATLAARSHSSHVL